MEQKVCTNLQQSQKLIEAGVDPNTADMHIGNYVGTDSGMVDGSNVHYYLKGEFFGAPQIIPAWSLSGLLGLVPDTSILVKDGMYYYEYNQITNAKKAFTTKEYDNPLDAAFELVCWLYKKGGKQ